MRYVKARADKEAKEMAYRIYVTDCLKYISENTARFAGGNSPMYRYQKLLIKEPVETRTSEEIIQGIRNKIQEMG